MGMAGNRSSVRHHRGGRILGAWRPQLAEPATIRFALDLPPDVSIAPGPYAPQIVISPDGRQLVVSALEPGKPRYLWVRPLGSLTAQRLDKTEGASLPFWSPDGKFIGFFADDKLKKIPFPGGSPQTICNAGRGDGAAWNRDGVIVFAPEQGNALLRVQTSGGTVGAATTLDKNRGEIQHSWPQFLPDGKHFLYFALNQDPDMSGIYVQELGSQVRTLVLKNGSRGVYASDYLLFAREGVLLAQRLDIKRLMVLGEPLPLADDVNTNESNGRAAFHVSEDGVLVYRGGIFGTVRQLAWYDRQGKRLASVGEPTRFRGLSLSPDEKYIAFARGEKNGSNIWVLELASGILKRLTLDSQGLVPSGHRTRSTSFLAVVADYLR
jgi:hypothetical protein